MERCFFCGKMSTVYNEQGIPMCREHKDYEALNLKCPACGTELEIMKSKWGKFFNCFRCGNVSMFKAKQACNVYFMKKRV
jgi:hypothetical protein